MSKTLQEKSSSYNTPLNSLQTSQNVDQPKQYQTHDVGPSYASATVEETDQQPRQYRSPGGLSNTSPVPQQTAQGADRPREHCARAREAGTNYNPSVLLHTAQGIDQPKHYRLPASEPRTNYTSPKLQGLDQPRQHRSPSSGGATCCAPAAPLKTIQGANQTRQRRSPVPEGTPHCAAAAPRNRTSSSEKSSQRAFTAQVNIFLWLTCTAKYWLFDLYSLCAGPVTRNKSKARRADSGAHEEHCRDQSQAG